MPFTPAKSSSTDDYPLLTLSKRTSFSTQDMSLASMMDDGGPSSPVRPRTLRGNVGGGEGSRKGKKRLSDIDRHGHGHGHGHRHGEEGEALLGELGMEVGVGAAGGQSTGAAPPKAIRSRARDTSRTIPLRSVDSGSSKSPYAPNVVRNQKYTVLSFLPVVFYEQFKFFFNFYFLVVALSQFIPALKIGELHTFPCVDASQRETNNTQGTSSHT